MDNLRFTDVDGATWEASGLGTVRCLNDPDSDPDDWVPGMSLDRAEVEASYGPLELVTDA